MFQYTNTIVLNSLKDVTTGLDKIVKGSDNIEVRRVNKFLKSNVSAMYKRAASDPVIGKAEFTITNPGAKVSLLFTSSRLLPTLLLQQMLLKKSRELLIRFKPSMVTNISRLR